MINLTKQRLIFYFLLVASLLQAQIPMNHAFNSQLLEITDESVFPLNPFKVMEIQDSISSSLKVDNQFASTWIGRKLLNENLLDVQKEDYRFIINPLVGLQLGKGNNEEKTLWRNTRGVHAFGQLGKNFIFYTEIHENQAQFPAYINDFASQNSILPGVGIWKAFGKDRTAKDYATAIGYLSLQANKYINLQFGNGKHFFGEGYRSTLLSDNSFNYPYLRMITKFWKIEYVNLFTQMRDIRRKDPSTRAFAKKYTTAHYLNIRLNKKLRFGLFEATTYQDTSGRRGYDIDYLNPFILYRPIEYSLGVTSSGNALLGGHFAIQPIQDLTIYGQLILDEFKLKEFFGNTGWWANKYTIQLGIKSFNTFIPNLFIQTELNYARPYTYSHSSDSQNYGHYNQPLAHPLGANFIESVSHIRYRNKRWFAETEWMYAVQGRDFEESNWGSDIYAGYNTREQDYSNEILQGNRTTTLFSDTKIGYIVNPRTNLRLELGYIFRKMEPETPTTIAESNTTHYFHIGLISRINNHYYDF